MKGLSQGHSKHAHLWLWSHPLLMSSCGSRDCAYVHAISAVYALMRLRSCRRSAWIFCTARVHSGSPQPSTCKHQQLLSIALLQTDEIAAACLKSRTL